MTAMYVYNSYLMCGSGVGTLIAFFTAFVYVTLFLIGHCEDNLGIVKYCIILTE